MSDKELKVTDKRMFTPEGELREEYRFLGREAADVPPSSVSADRQAGPPPPAAEPPSPGPAAAGPSPAASSPPAAPGFGAGVPLEIPGTPPGLGGPSFYDLVMLLAEPVAIYLGDTPLPDGQTAEDLEMARLHIDLLDVLRTKTSGNVSAQEAAFLDDLLYRLRLRYVRKRG